MIENIIPVKTKVNSILNNSVKKDDSIILEKLDALCSNPSLKPSFMSNAFFTTFFANEKNTKYIAKLLSYQIDVPFEELKDKLKLQPTHLYKNKLDKKSYECDYVAKLDDVLINIEINLQNNKHQLERNIAYMDSLYGEKVVYGDKEYEYTRVIQINFCNFYFKKDNIKDIICLKNQNDELYTDKKQIINIYIPLIRKKLYNKKELSEEEKIILAMVSQEKEETENLIKCDELMK